MSRVIRPLFPIALAGVLALAASAARAQTQNSPNFRYNANPNARAAYNVGAARGTQYGYRAGMQNMALRNAYYGGGYYGVNPDPVGGYLSGAADVINSQGQFKVSMRQADILKEQQKGMKIDNRRKAFDEWQYEQANTPSVEDQREMARVNALRRSLNNPPLNEIWSGFAPNNLLATVQRLGPASQDQGPTIPIQPETLRHINVTDGKSGASVAMFRSGGKLSWPLVLEGDDYQSDRETMSELVQDAMKHAQDGSRIPPQTLDKLARTVRNLAITLKDNITKVSCGDYIAGKRYLNELESDVRALNDPNISNYATGKWSAQGRTVAELFQNLTSTGLRFGPADHGDEPYYTSLYRSMVDYVAVLPGMTPPPPRGPTGPPPGRGPYQQ